MGYTDLHDILEGGGNLTILDYTEKYMKLAASIFEPTPVPPNHPDNQSEIEAFAVMMSQCSKLTNNLILLSHVLHRLNDCNYL